MGEGAVDDGGGNKFVEDIEKPQPPVVLILLLVVLLEGRPDVGDVELWWGVAISETEISQSREAGEKPRVETGLPNLGGDAVWFVRLVAGGPADCTGLLGGIRRAPCGRQPY